MSVPSRLASSRLRSSEESVQIPYPDQTARMIIALLDDIGYASVALLQVDSPSPQDRQLLGRIVLASTDALERLLGAPSGCLQSATREGLAQWFATPTDS